MKGDGTFVELEPHEHGAVLPVKAHAGARRNGIVAVRQGMLCVSVTQAPEKEKANKAIAAELAKALQLRPANIELLGGGTSARKRFLLAGATPAEIRERLDGLFLAGR